MWGSDSEGTQLNTYICSELFNYTITEPKDYLHPKMHHAFSIASNRNHGPARQDAKYNAAETIHLFSLGTTYKLKTYALTSRDDGEQT